MATTVVAAATAASGDRLAESLSSDKKLMLLFVPPNGKQLPKHPALLQGPQPLPFALACVD